MKKYYNKRNCSVPCCKKVVIANHKWTCALRSIEERFLNQGSEKDARLIGSSAIFSKIQSFGELYCLLARSEGFATCRNK